MNIPVTLMDTEDRCARYVDDNPIEIYIDYNDQLSDKQLESILQGNADEVRFEIECDYEMYGDDEYTYYKSEMASDLDISEDDIQAWFDSVDGYYPGYYVSEHGWNTLLRNSSSHITCTMWDADWNFNDWAYGSPLIYRDVRDALKLLGINPKAFRDYITASDNGSATAGPGRVKGYFPNMPDRVPKVKMESLIDDMIVLYNGVLNFAVGDMENVAAVLQDNPEYVTFKAGTNIVMYDFNGGAGIVELPLIADVTVKTKDVEFRNDSSIMYGMQECYGFTEDFWRAGSVKAGK